MSWGIPHIHPFHSPGVIKEDALGNTDQSLESRVDIQKRICQFADRIIASNPQEEADLVEVLPADHDKITIIPCGVNLDLFRPLSQNESKKEIAFSPDDFLITYYVEEIFN